MLPNSARGDVVLRLLDGRSEQRELVFEGGRARTPFALGSRGGWRIDAGHVAEAHVLLAFNGHHLYVCASRDEMALLDGVPLDAQWREAPTPSELRFGSARMSIGRRAGPEEDTQSPEPEATRMVDMCLPKRAPTLLRSPRDDEDTCFDEERLRAALALSRQDEDVTRIAELDAPAVATKVALPFRRPAIRTIRMPTASRLSSMPPTNPSEAPFRVAPSRPSSPTMAVPLPSDVESGALAVSGETSLVTSTAPPVSSRVPSAAPEAVPRGKVGELAHGWKQASLAKRAIVVLMLPALICALFAMRRPARVSAEPAVAVASAVAVESAAAVAVPSARAAASPSVGAAPIASAAPITSAAPIARSKADAAGIRDTRTAERRALDTVASGLDASAVEQYEVLAREHPDNLAFLEAARILRQRPPHATQFE